MDPFSLIGLKIEMFYQKEVLATGTAFVIENSGSLYIVTNKHNVTGRDPETNRCLNKDLGIPDSLIIWYCVNQRSLEYLSVRVLLYDSNGSQKWIEHPDEKIDVVLLPLLNKDLKDSVLDLSSADIDIKAMPAMPISIIGFPLGNTSGKMLPVWVTGSIASEPDIDINNKPLFYVNALGRQGLSGSPVVLRFFGSYHDKNGGYNITGGVQTRFMGIYSGRVTSNVSGEKESDICIVWKPVVIDQILTKYKQMIASSMS
jgi:Trypsin-like peptidase domain